MKKKSLVTLIITSIFTFVALTSAAHAGNVQRERWEGIAIGLGTAIIGSVLLNQHKGYTQQPQATYNSSPKHGNRSSHSRSEYGQEYGPEPDYGYGYRRHHYTWRNHPPVYRKGHHRRGHWEMIEKWVPPTHKKVWNPGHYTRHGKWKSGRWIRIEDKPGYWTKTRVWVARR